MNTAVQILSPAVIRLVMLTLWDSWCGVSDDRRPWGVWICRYASLDEQAQDIYPSVDRLEEAWFMDDRGIRAASIHSYARCVTVHLIRPWWTGWNDAPENVVFGRNHQIGIASFAAYQESGDVYLDYQWGGTYGNGWRVPQDQLEKFAVGLPIGKPCELWRS
jgi:hypothetical protein